MMGMATVTDQLRRAVEECGQTRYAISKATGIPASVLSRFVADGRGLRSENIDRLCAYLGLVLTAKIGKRSTKGAK
jgi:plasmid maintenance system antidote protein VapI